MKRNTILWAIFILAIAVRFYFFRESVYFGFDEARDAFISQAIYNQGDIKIIGPAASGVTGLNHGVLHWYLVGIFYLIGGGSPFFVAGVYRVLNSLAIFPIFWITNQLFNKRAAYIASLIFAVSFEATQYSIYYGNPSLAVWSWILLFMGAVVIYKSKNKFWGLPLMATGIATGIQFELFLITLLPIGIILLTILRKNLKKIDIRSVITAILIGAGLMSTYILAEVKNGFRSVSLILNLLTSSYNTSSIDSKWMTYVNRLILLFHDNFSPLHVKILWSVAILLICFLLIEARKKVEYRLILVWIFGGFLLTLIGSYNVYYVNVGIGTGVIIGLAVLINKVLELNKYFGALLICISIIGNFGQIRAQNKEGLIQDIKTQQYMQLNDEIKVMDEMYSWANNSPFTMRITSMPYKIQTVWAYVFTHYGQPKYGYLPFYETGNVLGYPGFLPEPRSGTTCVRFLLKEPGGGIPKVLFDNDVSEENLFSNIEEVVHIGRFTLEKRVSKDEICDI